MAIPLQGGIVFGALLFYILLFTVFPFGTGFTISVVTLPLLYLTGYGFVPLQWTPLYGMSFRRSAIRHTIIGSLVFGLVIVGALCWLFFGTGQIHLPLIGPINGALLIIGGILTLALVSTVVLSIWSGVLKQDRKFRQVLPLVGVWIGYPLAHSVIVVVIELLLEWNFS